MHFHAEIHLTDLTDVERSIQEVLRPFEETYDEESDELSGFWDWWQIGGRWTGEKSDYDPRKDPQNVETCWICHGTGFRRDDVGEEARKSDPSYTCNGCGEYKDGRWGHCPLGAGKRLKWPTQWEQHAGDILPVGKLPDGLTCYTLVVGGAAYHQQERNGEDIVKTDFDGKVLPKLEELGVADGYLATVDYHR